MVMILVMMMMMVIMTTIVMMMKMNTNMNINMNMTMNMKVLFCSPHPRCGVGRFLNAATTPRPVSAWSSGTPLRTPSAECRATTQYPRSAQPQSMPGVIPGVPNPGVSLECPPPVSLECATPECPLRVEMFKAK